jgi:hypothetical protein
VDSTATGVAVSADVGVNVGINVEAEGEVSGLALSDAGVAAEAAATGIDGGEGDDTITNEETGVIDLTADSTATGVAVSLGIAGKVAYQGEEEEETPKAASSEADDGVSSQALSDSSATAMSTAVGIDGGGGVDEITNRASILGAVGSGERRCGRKRGDQCGSRGRGFGPCFERCRRGGRGGGHRHRRWR